MGKLIVEATYYFASSQRRDCDNCHKVMGDGIAEGLGVDDSRFLWRDMDVFLDRKSPRVEITIYSKEDQDAIGN